MVFGNVLQTSADAIYLARHVGLRSGLPIETPAVTVNRLCGSGFEAVAQAAQQIVLGESEVVLAGGTESMSQAPHVVRGARWGLRLGPAPFEDSLWEALRDPSCGLSMAETAENLAEQVPDQPAGGGLLRGAQPVAPRPGWKDGAFTRGDRPGFDPESEDQADRGLGRRRAHAARHHARSAGQAAALLQEGWRGHGRERLRHLRRRRGSGARQRAFASERGPRPIGRLLAWASAGVEPSIMGIGPAPAARKALARAGLKLDEMDLVEVNEAFAAQYLAVEQELGLDRERTNVDGGAIAIGHPLGASGARITLHLLHALRRRGGRYGLGSACIGGGQGAAVIVEAFSSLRVTPWTSWFLPSRSRSSTPS